MTCGGIYSISQHYSGNEEFWTSAQTHACYQCQQPVERDVDLFVVEWDSYLHRRCLGHFLCQPEGLIVVAHGHEIVVVPELAREEVARMLAMGKRGSDSGSARGAA